VPDAPAAHLRALGERLDRDGRVEFKNGAVVEAVEGVDLRVEWPGTEEYGYVNEWAHDQLGRAYALAAAGAPPPEPPPPPPPRRQPTARDWGPCPF
jgi:hypothetical protein